jgi:hypothetical protein
VRIEAFSFGQITIDGVRYEVLRYVVRDGEIQLRSNRRANAGSVRHTRPASEPIAMWGCGRRPAGKGVTPRRRSLRCRFALHRTIATALCIGAVLQGLRLQSMRHVGH